MPSYKKLNKQAEALWRESEQLSLQVPNVMQKRLSLIATHNPFVSPSHNAKHWQEMEQMVNEKPQAFFEAWQQMVWQTWQAQQNLTQTMVNNWIKLSFGQPIAVDQFFYQTGSESLGILRKGLQPFSRRVNANDQRLK